ncbi:MAG: diguanylate cyclase domain-containing protein [Pleurocapsa sp.]
MTPNHLSFPLINFLNIIDAQEIDEAIDVLEQEFAKFKHTRQEFAEKQQKLELLVCNAPAAIAMLDCEMRYVVVSDRWIKDFQLEGKSIVGRTHYEMFPKISSQWRQDYQDCLTGKVDFLEKEEESLVRFNGQVDWLRWELKPWHNSEGNIGGLLILCEVITERKLLEQQLRSSESQMRKMFEAMTDLVLTVDSTSDSIQVLPTKLLDCDCVSTHNQIIEQTQAILFDSFEADNYQNIVKKILETKETAEFEYSLELDNQLVWFSVSLSPLSDTIAVWAARNITHRKEIEQSLFAEKELAQVTLKSIGDAVITTDASGTIQYINPVAEVLTGCKQSDAQGKPLVEVFQIINEHTREVLANPVDMVLQKNCAVDLNADIVLISHDGTEYAIENSATPIQDRQGNFVGAVIVFRDVTQSRNLTRKLSWQANHDALTGLYNRRKFKEQVNWMIKDAQKNRHNHIICYLDLDRFKTVNDSCGHAAGDKLLKQVSNLIKQRIRRSDVFARLGGDEFGLLLHQCSIETAKTIANQIRQVIYDFDFVWEDRILKIGVSIGIVPLNRDSWDDVMGRVDAACYAAKKKGRNCVHILYPA